MDYKKLGFKSFTKLIEALWGLGEGRFINISISQNKISSNKWIAQFSGTTREYDGACLIQIAGEDIESAVINLYEALSNYLTQTNE